MAADELLPRTLPVVRGGRPRKQWRYIGLFGEEATICAARVAVGPLRQSFWARWDRDAGRMTERTRRGPRGDVRLDEDALRIDHAGIDLRLTADGEPITVVSDHGAQRIWTRKQPVCAEGTLRPAGSPVVLRGLVDVSLGHHARVTAWRWCAGAGVLTDGREVTWNLVDGIHDDPEESERFVWVAGVPQHLGPAVFAPDLSAVRAGPLALAFTEEARRARTDSLWPLVRSSYVQPFGTFSGTLGPGLELAAGHGVMERHDARW